MARVSFAPVTLTVLARAWMFLALSFVSRVSHPTLYSAAVRSVGEQERRRCACFAVLAVVCVARIVSQIAVFAGLHGQCRMWRPTGLLRVRRSDVPVYHVSWPCVR